LPAHRTDPTKDSSLINRQQESLTIYTDGFRAYDPLEDDENYQRKAVIHGDGEYVDGDAQVNTCATRRWCDGGSRRTEASQKISSRHISELSNFAAESYVNLVERLSKKSSELFSDSPTTCFT